MFKYRGTTSLGEGLSEDGKLERKKEELKAAY